MAAHKGDWLQLTVASAERSNSPLVLRPPAHHGDAVALSPLADSEYAAVSLVAAASDAAEPTTATLLASGNVVTVQLAGGFLTWAAAADGEDGADAAAGPVPRSLLWVDEDEVAEAEKATLQPCRFRVEATGEQEGDGGGMCVGASLVLVPDGGERVLIAVASTDSQAPFRLALAPPSATAALEPVVFALESVVYSAYPDGIQLEPERAEASNSPASPAGSSPVVVAVDEEGEGEELEVVFEEGDLGITIKRTPVGQARVLRALPGTQAERNGVRAGDLLRAVGDDYDLRSVVLDSRSWADLIQRMKTAPRPLRVTVLRGGPGVAAAMEEGGSELHALERRLDFSGLTGGGSSSRPPGLLPLDDRKRTLLYRGRLALLQEGRLFGHSLQPRDAFLLSDALLLVVPPPEGSRQQQRATVEAAIGLATCKLRGGTTHLAAAASSLPNTEFGFEVVTPSGSFALFAPTAAAREQWVERIYRGVVALLQLAPHTQRPRRSPCPSPQGPAEQEEAEAGEPIEMEVDLEADALVRHQLVIGTLHSAVLRGHVDEARALLAAACSNNGGDGASAAAAATLANAQDAAGRTSLHYACLVRRHDLASLLLSRQGGGADPSIPDKRGRLPLHLAALALDDVAIALLLSFPASQPLVNARDAEGGRTPAFLAAVHGRLPSNNNNGSSTSAASGGEGDEEFALRRCLNALLAHDADVNARDHAGRAPLHLVSSALRFDAARALLDMGADANCYSDDTALTPLMLACRDAATDLAAKRAAPSFPSALDATLQVLLQQGGAQPNLRAGAPGGGRTALHLLLENGTLDWADKAKALGVLLGHGARLDVPAGAEPPVTGQQLIAALLRGEESGEKKEHKAALDAAVGAGKSAWGLKKAGTSSSSDGSKAPAAAASKLPEPIVSRLLSKAAARPTIRPVAPDAAGSSGGGGAGACLLCGDAFNALTKRPQHCRLCGHQVCSGCSSKKLPLQVPGSNGEAARVCDGCFNWGTHQIASALAAEAEKAKGQQEGAFSGPEAVARARQRREERAQAQAQQEAAEHKELFGAKAAALGERAMSWLMGEQPPAGDERRQRQAAAARVAGQMEEVRVGLQQRGERIENLADRTNELVDSSAQFAAMARQLNEQSRGWGGLW